MAGGVLLALIAVFAVALAQRNTGRPQARPSPSPSESTFPRSPEPSKSPTPPASGQRSTGGAHLTVTPCCELSDGQEITVMGTGFAPRASVQVCESNNVDPDAATCSANSGPLVPADAHGAVSTKITVHVRFQNADNEQVNCEGPSAPEQQQAQGNPAPSSQGPNCAILVTDLGYRLRIAAVQTVDVRLQSVPRPPG